MSNSSRCYFASADCMGGLWRCETCRESFCEHHGHITDKGANVECVACESTRKEEEAESRLLAATRRAQAESIDPLSRIVKALEAATPDWVLINAGHENNFDGSNIEVHDGFGRTATVYGERDSEEAQANADLIVLARKHLADLVFLVNAARELVKASEGVAVEELRESESVQSALKGLVSSGDVKSAICRLVGDGAGDQVEVFSGYLTLDGVQARVNFHAPVGASTPVKDAAFMAALAQQCEVEYLSMGTTKVGDVAD